MSRATVNTTANLLEARPERPSPLAASLTHTWRTLLKLRNAPSQLFSIFVFPVIMTLMMSNIFGGAIAGSVANYVQQLIPGLLVLIVTMGSAYTALSLNADINKGIFDRFRSLSFWRPAVLVGALLGDLVRYAATATVIIVLGLILGFRPDAGVLGVLLAFLLLLVFAFSLSWIWTTLGLIIEEPGSVSMISGMATFPLTFVSNVFVDPATMPAVLQPLVNINPVSVVTTAVRGLIHGTATSPQIFAALLGCAVLLAIFAPLTMRLYNRKDAV